MNFILLNIFEVMLVYISKISAMPATREKKRGEKAWEECARYRNLIGIFELGMVINIFLWIYFPIPEVSWVINQNFLVGIVIGICIGIPNLFLLVKGMKDAGAESLHPSKETVMFEGIYKYIRHPQNLGELSLFIALAFGVNSLFLVIWVTVSVILILLIITYFEEKDLVERFGDSYIKYKQATGAFIPKLRKRLSEENP